MGRVVLLQGSAGEARAVCVHVVCVGKGMGCRIDAGGRCIQAVCRALRLFITLAGPHMGSA